MALRGAIRKLGVILSRYHGRHTNVERCVATWHRTHARMDGGGSRGWTWAHHGAAAAPGLGLQSSVLIRRGNVMCAVHPMHAMHVMCVMCDMCANTIVHRSIHMSIRMSIHASSHMSSHMPTDMSMRV